LQAKLNKAALDADQAAKRAAEASEHAKQAYARLLAAESAARSKTALRESLAIKAEVSPRHMPTRVLTSNRRRRHGRRNMTLGKSRSSQ